MAREVVFKGKLLAKNTDYAGYTTYVFEDLNAEDVLHKYVMCVQFPNWEQSTIVVGDTGFVSVRFVKQGIDTWFDGVSHVPYKRTDAHFIKFIKESIPIDIAIDGLDMQIEEQLKINIDE